MREPARLSGELLARKGRAMPTTGFAQPEPAGAELRPAPGGVALQRYGPGPAGAADNVVRVAAPLRRRPPAGPPAADRVALTLRLDRDRHRRLRIFSARHEATSQDVIVRALDAYFAACGDDCPCLRDTPERCVRI